MFDLVYTPSSGLADVAIRAALLVFGAAIAVHMLCACNFMRRAPHWLKGGVLVPTVGAGVAMVMGALLGQVSWALLGAAAAACLLLVLSVAQWWFGVRMSDVFDAAMAIRAGEAPPDPARRKAPFQMREQLRQAAHRVMVVGGVFSGVAALALLTGAPQRWWVQLLDSAPAIGYHAAIIDAGEEVTTPGGTLQVRWNVERLRICETGLRTWMVDSAGTEHVLDLRVSAPSKIAKVEPGVINTYKRPYTIPATAAPGPAYITATVWHACNPVRSALRVYKHIHYNRAYFLIQPKDKP